MKLQKDKMTHFYGKLSKKGHKSRFTHIEASDLKKAKQKLQKENKGWKITGLGNYLVEAKLYFYLKTYFKDANIIYNEPLSKDTPLTKNIKPDFRIVKNNQIKLIVEFDGYQHYTKALEVLKDIEKDKIYRERDYKIIRFPYFIQLKKEIVNYYFGKSMLYDNSYSHGFVSKENEVLPANFCSLGNKRFLKEMKYYNLIDSRIVEDIIYTLKCKIANKIKTNKKWEKIIEKSVVSDAQIKELRKYGW